MTPAQCDAVAIIGMACRLPGGPSVSEFWTSLCEGRDATVHVPEARWDAEAIFDQDPKVPGKTNTRFGGFIEGIDRFDASFFGIAPREAAQMDPQQRILLEVAYEALEDAGFDPATLAGSDTAVFVGAMTNDYFRLQIEDSFRRMDVHTGAGAGLCMLANRLSYQFDLRGPSASIDTACSSSLVAVFQACQSLWTRQSQIALAAGVNVMLDPAFNVFYAKAGLSAPDGRCKTFSAAADGIGRAEGAAIIVLKRLQDAVADKDRIYAVIRGGAVNHDGRSNGLTQPNRWAQEQLLRKAFEHAGVEPAELQYIELHGTGTLIGDPIEANALGDVLACVGKREHPCLVGSVKTNFGHLEAAAGIAGLIKLALSLHHAKIPPSLWFDAPNPHIAFDRLALRVNTTLTAWPNKSERRLGGVSSFGLGGTNAHVVLEAPPPVVETNRPVATAAQHCLFLSARSRAALQAAAASYRTFIAAAAESELPTICSTAVRRKGKHDFRLSVLGVDRASLLEGLQAFEAGAAHPAIVSGRCRVSQRRLVVALAEPSRIDPQRLSHWIAASPVADRAWNACREACEAHGAAILPVQTDLQRHAPVVAGDSGFRLWQLSAQYTLLRQVTEGTRADIMVVADGFSQLAALCVSDVLPLSTAIRWLRAGLSDHFLQQESLGTPAYSLTCDFSTGLNPQLHAIDWEVPQRSWRARVEEIVARGEADVLVLPVDSIVQSDPPLRVEANDLIHFEGGSDGVYRLFAHLALRHKLSWPAWMHDNGFVCLPAYPWQREPFWVSSAIPTSMPVTAGKPSCKRVSAVRVEGLPNEELYAGSRVDSTEPATHPLLGRRADMPTVSWANLLSTDRVPYLSDHRVQGTMVLPGAGFIELGLAVHHAISGERSAALENVEFHKALIIENTQPPLVQVHYDEKVREFTVHSRQAPGGKWDLHARGTLVLRPLPATERLDITELRERCSGFIDSETHYRDMLRRGFGYGAYFQAVRQLWLSQSGEQVLAWVEGHETLAEDSHGHRLHPTLLDASLQALLTTLSARGDTELYVPTGIQQLNLYGLPGKGFWCYGGLRHSSPGEVEGEAVLFDEDGKVIAEARGVRAQALTRKQPDDLKLIDQWLYELVWESRPLSSPARCTGRWLIFMDGGGYSEALSEKLRAEGVAEIVRVTPADAFDRQSATCFLVRRESKADIGRVLEESRQEGIDGILYCWALDTPDDLTALAESSATAVPIVHILQLLSEKAQQTPTQLAVLTCGAQAVRATEFVDGVMQAPLIGLLRVAVSEYSAFQLRAIDIDRDVETLGALAREVLSGSAEDEIALRGTQRFARRMVRKPRHPNADASSALPKPSTLVRRNGTYLITGGFGGFGLQIAQWLVDRGARHLVLTGRSGAASAAAHQAVERFRRRDVQVRAVAADISKELDVRGLIDLIRAELPPLRGIFHTAAVLDDAPIDRVEPEQIANAMAAKALGAWHLHCQTLDMPPDHFVLFSSIASMVGGAGQATYAMACAFLDQLAHYRRVRQLPALSLNWGALSQVGMATRFADAEKYLSGSGVGMFTPAQAVKLLEHALRHQPVQLGIARMDWKQWSRVYPRWAASPKYGALVLSEPAELAQPVQEAPLQTLAALSAPAREQAILEILTDLLANTLKTLPERIDPSLPLPAMGMDSLMAMDLQAQIEQRFAVKIPMLELIKDNNLTQLMQQVATGICTSDPDASAPGEQRTLLDEIDLEDAQSVIARLSELAEDEVDQLLARLMSEGEIEQ